MSPQRIFLALTPDERTRERLVAVQTQLQRLGVQSHWEAPEKLHVTVRFLGDVDGPTLDTVVTLLQQRCGDHSPMDIIFSSIGVFPDERSPRVVWAGALPTTPLLALFSMAESVCRTAGLAPERREHHVHCTLGRFRRTEPSPNLTGALNSITFDPILTRASALSIMKSVLHQGGSTYTGLLPIPFSRTRSTHD